MGASCSKIEQVELRIAELNLAAAEIEGLLHQAEERLDKARNDTTNITIDIANLGNSVRQYEEAEDKESGGDGGTDGQSQST